MTTIDVDFIQSFSRSKFSGMKNTASSWGGDKIQGDTTQEIKKTLSLTTLESTDMDMFLTKAPYIKEWKV